MKRLLPILLLLSGCAAGGWASTQHNDPAKFDADKYQCIKDAEEHAANTGDPGNPFMVGPRFKECMRVKGYVWQKTT